MKKIALVLVCLLTGGMAFAQSHWVGRDQRDGSHDSL